jgi:hypothetical protein
MMRQARPLAQITAEAIKILYREIGIVDTLRFVSQYTTGCGDYTAEREQLFAGMTLDDIVSEIKKQRKRGHFRGGRKVRVRGSTSGKRLRARRDGRQKAT